MAATLKSIDYNVAMTFILNNNNNNNNNAPERIARHQVLNDLVSRAFASASIPVIKEPVGLLRSDGKRPDGLTLVPWQSGKPLTWDVTVTHARCFVLELFSS